jgi:hypothetical protein
MHIYKSLKSPALTLGLLTAYINRAARARQAEQRATPVDGAFGHYQWTFHPHLHGWKVGYDPLHARGRFNLR